MDGRHVGGSLDADDGDGQPPGHLVHLLASALTLHLELPEIGHEDSEELDHDGRGDVGHHSQREDGGVAEGSAGEHVEQSDEALLSGALEGCKHGRVDARKHHKAAQPVDQDEQECVDESLAELLNLENVLYSLDELHRTIRLRLPFRRQLRFSRSLISRRRLR